MSYPWLPTLQTLRLPVAAAACFVATLSIALPATAAERMVLCEEFTNTG
jgi:hypothetical protein